MPARPASDSSSPGVPLTQARRIAADSSSRIAADSCPLVVGRESQCPLVFTPPSAAHRPRRSREITPPSVGKANPPSAAASSVEGKANPRPRFTSARSRLRAHSSPPAPAVVWSSPPAAAIICQASRLWYPQTAAAVLTSQPAVAVFDQTVTTVFLTVYVCLAPEDS